MSSLDHPAVAKVAAALIEAGQPNAAANIQILPAEARTAITAAEALKIEVGAIANSLIFEADGNPILVLASGAHRVDITILATLTGAENIRMATPQFVKEHTGQVIGGVAPLGHPEKIITLVDSALAQYDVIWAAAGHSKSVFPTTFSELVTCTQGRSVSVGESANEVSR